MAKKMETPEEPGTRGNVVLTEADWALLQGLGGKRGMSKVLREWCRRKRNALNWHRIKAAPAAWASVLQAADAAGVDYHTYLLDLHTANVTKGTPDVRPKDDQPGDQTQAV